VNKKGFGDFEGMFYLIIFLGFLFTLIILPQYFMDEQRQVRDATCKEIGYQGLYKNCICANITFDEVTGDQIIIAKEFKEELQCGGA